MFCCVTFSEAKVEALLRLPRDEEGSRRLHHGERRGKLSGADRGSQAVHERSRIQDLIKTETIPNQFKSVR